MKCKFVCFCKVVLSLIHDFFYFHSSNRLKAEELEKKVEEEMKKRMEAEQREEQLLKRIVEKEKAYTKLQ